MHTKFLYDFHWYIALLLAVLFWILYGFFVSPLHFTNVFDQLNVFLLSVVLYPILEEIVFRGVVQDFLSRKSALTQNFIGLSLANAATSILFALSHLLNQEPLWALLTFFPSLVFGYFKDRHQSLFPCILLHIFYNLGFFVFIV